MMEQKNPAKNSGGVKWEETPSPLYVDAKWLARL
jgi:hypothetical protein